MPTACSSSSLVTWFGTHSLKDGDFSFEQKSSCQAGRKFQPGCSQPQPATPEWCLAKQSLLSAQPCALGAHLIQGQYKNITGPLWRPNVKLQAVISLMEFSNPCCRRRTSWRIFWINESASFFPSAPLLEALQNPISRCRISAKRHNFRARS